MSPTGKRLVVGYINHSSSSVGAKVFEWNSSISDWVQIGSDVTKSFNTSATCPLKRDELKAPVVEMLCEISFAMTWTGRQNSDPNTTYYSVMSFSDATNDWYIESENEKTHNGYGPMTLSSTNDGRFYALGEYLATNNSTFEGFIYGKFLYCTNGEFNWEAASEFYGEAEGSGENAALGRSLDVTSAYHYTNENFRMLAASNNDEVILFSWDDLIGHKYFTIEHKFTNVYSKEVAISGNGRWVVLADHAAYNGDGAFEVYYNFNPSSSTNWIFMGEVKGFNTEGLGYKVALADNQTLAVLSRSSTSKITIYDLFELGPTLIEQLGTSIVSNIATKSVGVNNDCDSGNTHEDYNYAAEKLSISADGKFVVFNQWYKDDGAVVSVGEVKVYSIDGETPPETAECDPCSTTTTTTTTTVIPTTTTTTTTLDPVTCAELKCLRDDGRGQRSDLRETPFTDIFVPPSEDSLATTTTTTTTTTISPDLLDLVSYPQDAECPYVTTTQPPNYFDATGGNGTSVYNKGKSHIFTSDGSFCINPYYESEFTEVTITYLIVGGGGGGGNNPAGGGGGGGQVRTGSVKLESGCYDITIGLGAEPGNNGSETLGIGITAVGGGGGGSVYFDGQDAANGGGGGGKGIGGASTILGGYRGGSSFNYRYGGGGGGAGGHGGTVFTEETKPGVGGTGKSSDIQSGVIKYYGGGGAGGAKDGTQQSGGLGGGGSTLSKNGEVNTGGGGAAEGSGGDGICILHYAFSTTTTTTTTIVPTQGPDAPADFVVSSVDPYTVTLSWTPITNTGDCPDVHKYVITYNYDDTVNTLEFNMLGNNLLSYDDQNNKFSYEIDQLPVDDEYTYNVFSYNSCDLEGAKSTETFQHVTTTTTTTTTLPPENLLEFRFDFIDFLTNGLIPQSTIIYTGEQNARSSLRVEFVVSDNVPDNWLFLEEPSIDFGTGNLELVRGTSIRMSGDKRSGEVFLDFIMPDSEDAQIQVILTGTASEPTATTTTTTSTTTLPPFCLDIYSGLADGVEPEEEGPNETSDYKLRPLQLFISRRNFPYQLTGEIVEEALEAGRPWYGGKLFEQERTPEDGEAYISSLSDDHNLLINYDTGFGFDESHSNIFYRLVYPTVVNGQSYIQLSDFIPSLSSDTNQIRYDILVDFVCTVESPDIFGFGTDEIEGFVNLKISERNSGLDDVILYENTVRQIDERFTGQFTTAQNRTYYFMLDYGTDVIEGKA